MNGTVRILKCYVKEAERLLGLKKKGLKSIDIINVISSLTESDVKDFVENYENRISPEAYFYADYSGGLEAIPFTFNVNPTSDCGRIISFAITEFKALAESEVKSSEENISKSIIISAKFSFVIRTLLALGLFKSYAEKLRKALTFSFHAMSPLPDYLRLAKQAVIKVMGNKCQARVAAVIEEAVRESLEKPAYDIKSIYETCMGMGGVFLNVRGRITGEIPYTINDIDQNKYTLYKCIQNCGEARVASECIATMVSYDSFYYTIDSSSVSKEEYDAACQAKRDSYTQPVYYSYEEMKEILSAKYIPPQDEIDNTDSEETDWKTAYQWVVYDYQEEWSEYYYDMEYALIYVDNNDIPELYMKSTTGQMSTLYTYYHNQAVMLINSQGRDHAFSPSSIVEKNSKIWTVGSGGSTVWSYDCFTIYKGLLYRNESVTFDCYEDEYTINNEAVSEDEFYDKDAVYGELSNQGSADIVYYSYDEIMELLQ